jgi:hypothetical protein
MSGPRPYEYSHQDTEGIDILLKKPPASAYGRSEAKV